MIGHINLNVRLELVSLSALFAKTQALYLRGKWWNKTLNYGTPQVFNLHVGLCKKKKMRKKFLKGNVFVEYGPVQGSWLPCFGWRDNSALLVSAPFFNCNVFSFGLVLVEEEEKWGGEGRGPPPSLFSSKHPASPTDSQQWTTISKDASWKKTAENVWYVSAMFSWWAIGHEQLNRLLSYWVVV